MSRRKKPLPVIEPDNVETIDVVEFSTESCLNCKFWKQLEGQRMEGVCRRYPPPQSFISSKGWCGEYHPLP